VKGCKIYVHDEVRVSMSAFAHRNCEKSQKSTQKVPQLRYEPGSTGTQVRSATACTNLLDISERKS